MGSFLDAFRAGQSVADTGIDAYDRARSWSERLKEKAQAKQVADTALKVEAAHYKDTRDDVKRAQFEKEVADDRAQGAQSLLAQKDASIEMHARKQDDLIDAEIASMRAGTGKNGNTRPAAIPPEVKAAMANRDSARKAISAVAAGGITTPPPYLQAKLDAAEGALSRVARKNSFDLGEDAAATEAYHKSLAAMQAQATAAADAKAHPVKTWFRNLTGQAAAGAPAAGNVVTKYRNGQPVRVVDHGDGSFDPAP